jgi:hypothetical protein
VTLKWEDDPEKQLLAVLQFRARAGFAGDGCCGAWDFRAYLIQGELLSTSFVGLSHAATVDSLLR